MSWGGEEHINITEEDNLATLNREIERLERIRGYLPYQDVICLNELKKQKLAIKDRLAGH